MPTHAGLSLKGLEKYIEDLAAAGVDVDASAARALIAGGDEIKAGQLAEIDRQNIYETGDLREHITRTTPITNGNVTRVDVGVFDGDFLPDGELARKALANEYGYTRGGKHYPARSYIRAGADTRRAAAMKKMKDSLINDGKL